MADFDVDEVLKKLAINEKIDLLAGLSLRRPNPNESAH
jgi:hypothetical protein